MLLRRLAGLFAAALVAFVVTNPFALIEFRAYAANILSQSAMVNGTMDAPYTRQYIGTLPYIYFIQQLSQWGLGWPLGIVAWGGFGWAIVAAGSRRATPGQTVAFAWALPYFATTGVFYAKFLRYMAPLLPFLLVFGAGAGLVAYDWLRRRWGSRGKIAWITVATAVFLFTAGWALAFTAVYHQEHPWIQASRWIYTHVPAGSKVLTEHWDDSLPLTLDGMQDAPPQRDYDRVELPLYDPDTPAKLDTLVDDLSSAGYVVIASNRLWRPIQRLPGRYPMTSRYYRLLFDGQLGYEKVAEFSIHPRFGPLEIPDENSDESFTVYDHPHVQIYANTEHLSAEQLRARLTPAPVAAEPHPQPLPDPERGARVAHPSPPSRFGTACVRACPPRCGARSGRGAEGVGSSPSAMP